MKLWFGAPKHKLEGTQQTGFHENDTTFLRVLVDLQCRRIKMVRISDNDASWK